MVPIHEIVVALDLSDEGELSPGSQLALELSEWVADQSSTAVTFVHSHHADEDWSEADETYLAAGTGGRLEQSPVLGEARARLEKQGIATNTAESSETAWLAVCVESIARYADLVIAGKRARDNHDGRPLGSVSFNLLRHCSCPVWVAKPGAPALPKVILAATDRTKVGAKAVSWAASIAKATGAELHVVHALQLPMSVQMEGIEAQERWLEEAREQAKEEIGGQVKAAELDAEVGIHVGLTSPTRAVLECVDRLEPDLLVMGTVSRGGVAGLVVGNTAERLLARVDCSILAVKPDDFISPVAR